jgi:hypothetical protein
VTFAVTTLLDRLMVTVYVDRLVKVPLRSENCAVLGHHAAHSGKFLAKFGDNLLVPSSLKMGSIACPETSLRNCHYTLRNNPEQRSSYLFPAEA